MTPDRAALMERYNTRVVRRAVEPFVAAPAGEARR